MFTNVVWVDEETISVLLDPYCHFLNFNHSSLVVMRYNYIVELIYWIFQKGYQTG